MRTFPPPVFAARHENAIGFRIDTKVPFFGNNRFAVHARFAAAGPLRRVPAFVNDRVTLLESTMIGEHPDHARPSVRSRPVIREDGALTASPKARNFLRAFPDYAATIASRRIFQ